MESAREIVRAARALATTKSGQSGTRRLYVILSNRRQSIRWAVYDTHLQPRPVCVMAGRLPR